MRYKEVHSIKSAEGRINELKTRIERAEQAIKEIKRMEKDMNLKFASKLISTRNRRIGQLNRQIKYYLEDIKNMKKINKSLLENIY